jgi:hypothetical protein
MADDKRVPVITADGKFGTISEKHAEAIIRSGGRVLGAKEAKEKELAADFEAQTTGQKVAGVALQGAAALSPELMAAKRGGEAGLTAGLAAPLEAKAIEAVAPGQGKAFAQRELDLKEAHEGAYQAGEAFGMVGGAVAGGASGLGAAGAAAKALPGAAIGVAGGAVERAVAGRVAGLAAKGVVGRALATSAEVAARGAFEGGVYSATQAAADQVLADPNLSAEKLYTADGLTAVGKAGLIGAGTGLAGGAVLGGAGSLAASGARRAVGGLARVMARAEPAAAEVAAREVAEVGPKYAPHPTANPAEMDTVMVNSDALDSAWQRDPEFYIGKGVDPQGRRAGFQEWRAKNPEAAIEASRVTIGEDGRAAFTDGRNRFAEMRDAGTKRVGVTMPKEDVGRLGPEWGAQPLMSAEAHAAQTVEQAATKAPAGSAGNSWLKKQSNEAAFRAMNPTKTEAAAAIRGLGPEGRASAGEWLHREVLAPGGFLKSAMKADAIYEAVVAVKYGKVLQGLTDAVKAAPARVEVAELAKLGEGIHTAMKADPLRAAGADSFLKRIAVEAEALGKSGKIAADGTIDAADAFKLRGQLERKAYELKPVGGDAAADSYKEYLRAWDELTVDAIDKAAAKLGKSDARENILHWKREYQLASAAERAAEGGAARMANNRVGLRVGIGALTALAHGNILGAAGIAGAGKIIQDRGEAMASYALGKLAERKAVAAWVNKVDGQIAKASKGLLDKPAKGLLRESDKMPPTRSLSRTALSKIAEFNADPESYLDRVARQHEGLAAHSPEIAESLTAKHVQAMTFMASKVPVSPDPDPFDPHPAPKLTRGEEAELGRYWYYAEKPARFYAEVARGKLTYEGAEVAQALTPGPFEQLQLQTAEALTERLAKGDRIPFRQRQTLGVLLDFAATPSQRPEHARFLQKNLEPLLEPPPPPAPGRKAATPIQRTSSYDRLEADGPGRR